MVYKNKDSKIKFYTEPGLHPKTRKKLDEITECTIEIYTPTNVKGEGSFVQ